THAPVSRHPKRRISQRSMSDAVCWVRQADDDLIAPIPSPATWNSRAADPTVSPPRQGSCDPKEQTARPERSTPDPRGTLPTMEDRVLHARHVPVLTASPDRGVGDAEGAVLTIPAGAVVELPMPGEPVGVCSASWLGRRVMVFREDVHAAASAVGGAPQ